MRIIDLENINYAMRNETQFVLHCEEVFHDKVSAAAAAILTGGRDKRIVALTGPSGSGKTTTAMRLRDYLENLGVKVCLLSMDNFFLPLEQRPPEATDWESPYCVNVPLLISCISQLLDGREVDIPWYDFKSGMTGGYRKMQGSNDCVVIAEGIHMLNPLIFDKLRGAANGIYVAPRTRILTDHDTVVRPAQLRTVRRMIRDYNTRGHSLRQTHTVAFGSFKEGLDGYPERPAPAVVAEIICDYAAVRLLRLLIVENDVRKVIRGLAAVYERQVLRGGNLLRELRSACVRDLDYLQICLGQGGVVFAVRGVFKFRAIIVFVLHDLVVLVDVDDEVRQLAPAGELTVGLCGDGACHSLYGNGLREGGEELLYQVFVHIVCKSPARRRAEKDYDGQHGQHRGGKAAEPAPGFSARPARRRGAEY